MGWNDVSITEHGGTASPRSGGLVIGREEAKGIRPLYWQSEIFGVLQRKPGDRWTGAYYDIQGEQIRRWQPLPLHEQAAGTLQAWAAQANVDLVAGPTGR